jgi:acyl carrier protein
MGLQILEVIRSVEETFGVSIEDTLLGERYGRMYLWEPPDISVADVIGALRNGAAASRVSLPVDAAEHVRRIIADKLDVPEDEVLDDKLLMRDLGA